MFTKFLFVFIACVPLFAFGLESDVVVRAALDIGSGATKLRVAEVNLETQKIEKILVNESFSVQYQETLEKSSDSSFNEEIMAIGIEALKKSQQISQQYNAQNVVAIATASFRKATNVQEFVERIFRETGIKVYIIDQELEGKLAFEATAAQFEGDPQQLVVWDVGGGSYQFSHLNDEGEIAVVRGLDASIPFKNHIIKTIKLEDPNEVTTPNPLNSIELRDSEYHARQNARKINGVFRKKIGQTRVVGIGNIFAYGIYPLIGKKSVFTQQELTAKVQDLAGKTDKDLGNDPYVNVAVTNPVMVLGFMQILKIHEMEIKDINNADGALLYAPFWE